MNKIIFIRHGSTEANLHKRYIGRTDEPLCVAGIAELQELKKKCFRIDKLFVSPMRRTKETAEILFPEAACTLVDDFREIDFGAFEGRSAAELSDNAQYTAWLDSLCQSPVPEGEGICAFKKRCCKAFEKAMKTINESEAIAFVVHGGTIMAILEAYAEPRRGFYDYHIANGQWISCSYEKGIICGVKIAAT